MEKDGIAAFVRKSLEDSEAWHRITSDDPDEVMPPPKFKKELTNDEVNKIKQWIEEGAKWEGHWAFIPIKKTNEPKTQLPQWIRNPIDAFVLDTLKERVFTLLRKQIVEPLSVDSIWISPVSLQPLRKLKIFSWIIPAKLTKE